MPLFGAHMSIAGGLPRAVDRAEATGCQALQIFTKSVGQWRARPLPPEEIQQFRDRIAHTRFPAFGHTSYLINIATSEPALRKQSIAALGEEVDRAEALGLIGLVLHPGVGPEHPGLLLAAEALATVLDARPRGRTLILLEHTAGQGQSLGWQFEHLAQILEHRSLSTRVGICLDTCHLVASGYDISSAEGYRAVFDTFDRVLGLNRLKIMHTNDSARPPGSRVDRHAHIGRGHVGLAAFTRLVNDRRLTHLPMILETPKAADAKPYMVDPDDVRNLEVLRGLLRHRR